MEAANKAKLGLVFGPMLAALALAGCDDGVAGEAGAQNHSASYQRFLDGQVRYEKFNPFNVNFIFEPLKGFQFEEGVERYYPSSVILVDGTYHMWYSRPLADAAVVGPNTADDTTRAFHWDLNEVYHATSADGLAWEEQGLAIPRGPKGRYDHRTVFNPDILIADGKYYLAYQTAGSVEDARWSELFETSGDFVPNVIGMSVADSPMGPWEPLDAPILTPGAEDAWDGEVVQEPTFFVKGGQHYLYYKSESRLPWTPNISEGEFNKTHADVPIAMGVAIADNPTGPYVRSELNPVLMGGHGTMIWPHGEGACASIPEGADRNSVLCSDDGINFHPVVRGLDLPWGGGAFRPGNYADVDEEPGKGLTWGVSHKVTPYYHFVRFEGDMSLAKAERMDAEYQRVRDYMDSEGYDYDPALGGD